MPHLLSSFDYHHAESAQENDVLPVLRLLQVGRKSVQLSSQGYQQLVGQSPALQRTVSQESLAVYLRSPGSTLKIQH